MSNFEKPMPTYRLAETHRGDTLQRLAAREMGDANRWPELVWINNLLPPYLTDDESAASDRILLTGSLIRVPASTSIISNSDTPEQVYERDCQLVKRRLTDDGNGDFAVVAGTANLTQQLEHRIRTPRGQAMRHPEYGNLIWHLHGKVNGPLLGRLGADYTKACLKADYRVAAVSNATATITGDVLDVVATAEAIAGGKLDISSGSSS